VGLLELALADVTAPLGAGGGVGGGGGGGGPGLLMVAFCVHEVPL
jgi:hypothetical protein